MVLNERPTSYTEVQHGGFGLWKIGFFTDRAAGSKTGKLVRACQCLERVRAAQSSNVNVIFLTPKCQRRSALLSRFTRRKSKPFTADPAKLKAETHVKDVGGYQTQAQNTDTIFICSD